MEQVDHYVWQGKNPKNEKLMLDLWVLFITKPTKAVFEIRKTLKDILNVDISSLPWDSNLHNNQWRNPR